MLVLVLLLLPAARSTREGGSRRLPLRRSLPPTPTHPPLTPHITRRCYDRKTLYQFARHHETGEPLPEELYQRLLAARTYR